MGVFLFYPQHPGEPGGWILSQEATDLAVHHCLKEGVLEDLLRKHRKEVVGMFLEEYDKELHEKTLRREGWEDGFAKASELARLLLDANRWRISAVLQKIKNSGRSC